MQLRLDVKGCVSKAAFRRVYEEGVVINRRLEVGTGAAHFCVFPTSISSIATTHFTRFRF